MTHQQELKLVRIPLHMDWVLFCSKSIKTKGHPVAFASHALNKIELCYAQIEKETLAVTWALKRFSEYVLGKVIQLETDHKPIIPLLGKKYLSYQVVLAATSYMC